VRILYLGLPLGALLLSNAGQPPTVVALGHPGAPGSRRLRRRLGAAGTLLMGRPALGDPAVRAALRAARPDLLLSWFWPRRIPREVLSLAPLGAFGVHPSLLPRWRGPDPYFWALRSGDAETGVSLHRLEPSYDTGEIIEQRVVPIEAEDDAWRLGHRLDRASLALLLSCAERVAAGETLTGAPQEEAAATWAPKPSDADLALDWKRPAPELERLVRAAAPHPGAGARIGDHEVEVVRARCTPTTLPAALEPSEGVRSDEGLVVRAGEGALLILEVRGPDGRVLRGAEVCSLLDGAQA